MSKTIGNKSSLRRILPVVSLNKFPLREKKSVQFSCAGFLKYQPALSADFEIYLLTNIYKQK